MPIEKTEPGMELLVEKWFEFYHRRRVLTIVISSIVILAIAVLVHQGYKIEQEKLEIKRLQKQDYAKQIESLSRMKTSLENLINFVYEQQKHLKETEDALTIMKNEHEKLKPLVEIDKKLIDALFAAQETRNRTAQITERWIGFGLGVGASLLASLVFAVISYVVKRRRNPPSLSH
jgi:hypothetical protein